MDGKQTLIMSDAMRGDSEWLTRKSTLVTAAAALTMAAVSWVLARHTSTSAANANTHGGPASPPMTGSAGNGGTSGTHTGFASTATGLFTRTPSPATRSARARIATRVEAA